MNQKIVAALMAAVILHSQPSYAKCSLFQSLPESIRSAAKEKLPWLSGRRGQRMTETFSEYFVKMVDYLGLNDYNRFNRDVANDEGLDYLIKGIHARKSIDDARFGVSEINTSLLNNLVPSPSLKIKKLRISQKGYHGQIEGASFLEDAEKAYYSAIYDGLIADGRGDMAIIHRDFPVSAMELGFREDTQFKSIGIKFKSSNVDPIRGLVPLNPLLSKDRGVYIDVTENQLTETGLEYLETYLPDAKEVSTYRSDPTISNYSDLVSLFSKARVAEINNDHSAEILQEIGFITSRPLTSEGNKTLMMQIPNRSADSFAFEWVPAKQVETKTTRTMIPVEMIMVVDFPYPSSPLKQRMRPVVSDIDLQTVFIRRKGTGAARLEASRGRLPKRLSSFIDDVSRSYSSRTSFIEDVSSSYSSQTSFAEDERPRSISTSSATSNYDESIGITRMKSMSIGGIPQRPIAHGAAIHADPELRKSGIAASPKPGETFRAFFLNGSNEMIVIDIENVEQLQIVCAMFGHITPVGCYEP